MFFFLVHVDIHVKVLLTAVAVAVALLSILLLSLSPSDGKCLSVDPVNATNKTCYPLNITGINGSCICPPGSIICYCYLPKRGPLTVALEAASS